MDDRRRTLRELEIRKNADIDSRNRLLESLGEALIQRTEEDEPFSGSSADGPARELAAEYRELQKEIADCTANIGKLEEDALKIRDLEKEIASREEEHSRLTKELIEVCTWLGKELLESELEDFEEFSAFYRDQEETLLLKISEHEQKIQELSDKEGGVFSWLGKNAQMAVSRALLSKNRSSLLKLYRSAGEQFLSIEPAQALVDTDQTKENNLESALKASQIKSNMSLLSKNLAALRDERRELGDAFGIEGNPARRIEGLEKRIAFVKEAFPGLYLRLGTLAATGSLASIMKEEDQAILEKAEIYKTEIAKGELAIEKIKASITIDNEKAEIEKMKRAIANQQQKIANANDAILELEKQIASTEQHIEELTTFLRERE